MLDVQIRKRLATGRKSGDSFSLDVSLSCATRRLVLFGHSGSGKTLTLQSLAGLVRPDGGYIKIGDDVLYASEKGIDLPARERHLGYVFQDYALFPHLTVRRNVEFALDKTKRTLFGRPSPAARKSVDDLLERFEVGHLAERYPREISGGQRQPLFPRPVCCCWTSRSPRWTRSSGSGCAARSAPCSTNGTSPSC